MNHTLTIEAGPGLIGAITLLTNAISGLLGQQLAQSSLSRTVDDEPKPAESKPETKAIDKKPAAAETKAEPDQPAEVIKIEDLRIAATTAGRDKTKATLDKLEYKKLTDIPESERPRFLAKLKEA